MQPPAWADGGAGGGHRGLWGSSRLEGNIIHCCNHCRKGIANVRMYPFRLLICKLRMAVQVSLLLSKHAFCAVFVTAAKSYLSILLIKKLFALRLTKEVMYLIFLRAAKSGRNFLFLQLLLGKRWRMLWLLGVPTKASWSAANLS